MSDFAVYETIVRTRNSPQTESQQLRDIIDGDSALPRYCSPPAKGGTTLIHRVAHSIPPLVHLALSLVLLFIILVLSICLANAKAKNSAIAKDVEEMVTSLERSSRQYDNADWADDMDDASYLKVKGGVDHLHALVANTTDKTDALLVQKDKLLRDLEAMRVAISKLNAENDGLMTSQRSINSTLHNQTTQLLAEKARLVEENALLQDHVDACETNQTAMILDVKTLNGSVLAAVSKMISVQNKMLENYHIELESKQPGHNHSSIPYHSTGMTSSKLGANASSPPAEQLSENDDNDVQSPAYLSASAVSSAGARTPSTTTDPDLPNSNGKQQEETEGSGSATQGPIAGVAALNGVP